MRTLIAWGNIAQDYPLHQIPTELLTDKLRQPVHSQNTRVKIRHRCRWVAHFLLWQLLKMSQKDTALLQHIYYSPTARPQLPTEQIDFNISHSASWVAVILQIADEGQQSAVGIDIEYPARARDYAALLAHFAPQDEQQWLVQHPQNQHEKAFYQAWCLREAVLKSQGVGIAKLSEVQHFPQTKQIFSPHCPVGQITFTDELPFYLAFFSHQAHHSTPEYWQWNGQTLLPYQLTQAVHYQVNV